MYTLFQNKMAIINIGDDQKEAKTKTYGVVTTQLSHFHLFEVVATVLIYTSFYCLVFFYFLTNGYNDFLKK